MTVLLHTVANRLAPKVVFPWIGMLQKGKSAGVLWVRLRDLLVVLLRSLMVFFILLYPAKPFLYRGKPPAEIWIKDVPPRIIRKIKDEWGNFARIRFKPSENPKGKVALVGPWETVPNSEYEVWSASSDWEIRDLRVWKDGLELKVYNGGEDKWFKITVEGEGGILLSDSFRVAAGEIGFYSATLPLSGQVTITLNGYRFYDYVLQTSGEGRVFAKGLEREIWEALFKATDVTLTVGVDTVINTSKALIFSRRCSLFERLGLKVRPSTVRFLFSDSGCIFLSGKPVLLDEDSKVVGVLYGDRYYFGFHPTSTGWAFTPRFLQFVSLLSETPAKIYASVGDTLKFPTVVNVEGPVVRCCVSNFVLTRPGIYRIKEGGREKGIIVVNSSLGVKIPDPPFPLWRSLIFIFLIALSLEMLITFWGTRRS